MEVYKWLADLQPHGVPPPRKTTGIPWRSASLGRNLPMGYVQLSVIIHCPAPPSWVSEILSPPSGMYFLGYPT